MDFLGIVLAILIIALFWRVFLAIGFVGLSVIIVAFVILVAVSGCVA